MLVSCNGWQCWLAGQPLPTCIVPFTPQQQLKDVQNKLNMSMTSDGVLVLPKILTLP